MCNKNLIIQNKILNMFFQENNKSINKIIKLNDNIQIDVY